MTIVRPTAPSSTGAAADLQASTLLPFAVALEAIVVETSDCDGAVFDINTHVLSIRVAKPELI